MKKSATVLYRIIQENSGNCDLLYVYDDFLFDESSKTSWQYVVGILRGLQSYRYSSCLRDNGSAFCNIHFIGLTLVIENVIMRLLMNILSNLHIKIWDPLYIFNVTLCDMQSLFDLQHFPCYCTRSYLLPQTHKFNYSHCGRKYNITKCKSSSRWQLIKKFVQWFLIVIMDQCYYWQYMGFEWEDIYIHWNSRGTHVATGSILEISRYRAYGKTIDAEEKRNLTQSFFK